MMSWVPAVAAVCGGEHTLMLLQDGRIASTGACGLGWTREYDVGDLQMHWRFVRTRRMSQLPTADGAQHPKPSATLAPGFYHNLVLDKRKGSVQSWGCGTFTTGNNDGAIPALGRGPTQSWEHIFPAPVDVSSKPNLRPSHVVDAAAGAYHSVVQMADGNVLTFGAGQLGQLGRDLGTNPQHDGAGLPVDGQPRPVEFGNPSPLEEPTRLSKLGVAAAFYNTYVLRDGKLWCAGENSNQQCGACDGIKNILRAMPVREAENLDVVQVHGGYCHTLVRTQDGKVHSLGCDEDGQRGVPGAAGPSDAPPVLARVDFPLPRGEEDAAVSCLDLAAGANHSIALCDVGGKKMVYTFGSNEFGQLGTGRRDGEPEGIPRLLLSPPWEKDGGSPATVSAGYAHSLVLDDKGRVWACGANGNGQLGTGDDEDEVCFKRVW